MLRSSWERGTRFYILELSKDIFDNWILKRTWGTLSRFDFGQSEFQSFDRYDEAYAEYSRQFKRRRKRRYEIVESTRAS